MRVLIDRSQMLRDFGAVAGVAPSRSPRPVMQRVKLEVGMAGSPAMLMATDGELAVTIKALGVKVDSPGAVLLPPDRFAPILRSCAGDDELAIEVDGSVTHIRGRASAFKLPGEDAGLFPDPPRDDAGPGWSVDPGELGRAIRRTIGCTDPDSTRYALAGVLFDFDPDDSSLLRLVATDGRRLAVQEVAITADAGVKAPANNTTVIPAKALRLADKLLDDDAPARISVAEGGSVLLRSGRATIWTRLVEGRFPAWRQVIPASFAHRVEFAESASLLAAVEQARITTSKESRGIDCEFDPGQGVLRLASTTADVGESSIELPVGFDAPNALAITLDGVYFAEALRAIGEGEAFALELGDHKSAVLFGTAEGYRCVVMPLNRERD